MNSPRDQHPAAATPPGDPSETLNDALDNLEDMLDLHGADGAPEQEVEQGSGGTSGDDDGAQYNIPLLSDVVTAPPTLAGGVEIPALDADHDYSESAQHMAERLSSEIDIIVQSAVDEAMDLLRRDIGERLREHLDITLPEVLEELVHLRRR